MKKQIFALIAFVFCFNCGAQVNKSIDFVQVPIFSISTELKDTLKNIFYENSSLLNDSCLMVHINTMDSSGKLLQVVLLPQQECLPEIYSFYVDNTFGVAFFETVIIFIYGRSLIDKLLAVKTNSAAFIKVKSLDKNTIIQSDEYFPKTIYIDYRDNK